MSIIKPKLYLKRSVPTILTIISTVGVVATAITTAQATLKAEQIIKADSRKNHDGDPYAYTKKEAVVSALPCYILPATIGISTISCIFGINVLSKKHQASLMSAYMMLDRTFKEYREKLIELYGEETDNQIMGEICRCQCNYHQINADVPDSKFLFYEPISGETFEKYEKEVMDAEYHFNRNFTMRGYACLNEFYEFLGLPETEYGEKVGWSMSDEIYWVDFQHHITMDNGYPICELIMIFPPYEEYMREWE